MRRLLVAVLMAVAAAPGMALACAVPSRIELQNATAQDVRALLIDDEEGPRQPPSTFNRLRLPPLAPGAAVTITFPSCIGTYVFRAVFADGSEQRHAGIVAGRIRVLTLR